MHPHCWGLSHLRSASHLLALRGLQSRVRDSAMIDKPERRFPPPWSGEAIDACVIVCDANGKALA